MAIKKSAETVETAENTAREPVKNAKSEQKYTVEKLRKSSVLVFGVTQSTFDGAMYGHTKEEYTIKEAEAIINKWLYGKEGE